MFFDSSEETVNTAEGNNNLNNVVITEPVQIEHKLIQYLLIVITVIKVIELAFVAYRCHQRRLKKKYSNTHGHH